MKRFLLGLIIGVIATLVAINTVGLNENEDGAKNVKREIPECYLGKCPQYFSMDVDGDSLSESSVVVPLTMTKGYGKVLIIDEGKIVFDSRGMINVWITQTEKQIESGNGFTLTYGAELDSNETSETKYVYKDGLFEPEVN